MKEIEIIKKLSILKSIQPNNSVLENIKSGLDRQIRTEIKVNPQFGLSAFLNNIYILLKPKNYVSYGAAFALLLVIYLSASTGMLQTQIHKIIFYSRLASVSNQYEKASIALADTTDSYKNREVIDTKKLTEISRSITLANNELAKLKLKGEIGKYTALQ